VIGHSIEDAAAQGARDARAFLEQPGSIVGTPLADFGAGGSRDAALRRRLHELRLPPRVVASVLRRRPETVRRFAYWAGAQTTLDHGSWAALTRGPVILAYHGFGSPGERPSRLVIAADRFERQMQWLAQQGRPVIGLEEIVACRRESRLPPPDAVAITVDDGYADFATIAAPILRRHGFPAAVFVVSGRVGGENDWDRDGELSGRPLLSWPQLEELQRQGVAIGAHTHTHPVLTAVSAARLQEELECSRDELDTRLGRRERTFAYPHGKVDDVVARAVSDAGFAAACSIERGLNTPGTSLVRLRRALVDGDVPFAHFSAAVRFGDAGLGQGLARIGLANRVRRDR